MNASLKTIITIILLFPFVVFGQRYFSDRQLNLLRSGGQKIEQYNSILLFSTENMVFSYKYEVLKETIIHDLSLLYQDADDDGNIETMFAIEGDINYAGLKVIKFASPRYADKSPYYYTFTIFGIKPNGDIAYYTTFYANER